MTTCLVTDNASRVLRHAASSDVSFQETLHQTKLTDEPFVFQVSEADAGQLTVFARLSDYHVYTTLNAKSQFRAPTEWGLCLRPAAGSDDETDPGLRCLACDTERARTCWLTAMRLAKVTSNRRDPPGGEGQIFDLPRRQPKSRLVQFRDELYGQIHYLYARNWHMSQVIASCGFKDAAEREKITLTFPLASVAC